MPKRCGPLGAHSRGSNYKNNNNFNNTMQTNAIKSMRSEVNSGSASSFHYGGLRVGN